jgi:hypothetical protein
MLRLVGNTGCILGAALGGIVCAQLLNVVAVIFGIDPNAHLSGVVGPTIAGLFWGLPTALVAARFYEPLKYPVACSRAVFTCGLAMVALEFVVNDPNSQFPSALAVIASLVLSAGATLGLYAAASILSHRLQHKEV